MTKQIRFALAAIAGLGFASLGGTANAADPVFFVLPTPENNPYATYGTYKDALGIDRDAILMNGIPVALKYDDFWSYSAHVLDAMQSDTSPTEFLPTATFGAYDFKVGTGTIAVLLTSGAGGATNLDPNGSGVNFQDPVDIDSSNANNTDFGWTGSWGGLNQTYAESPPTSQDYSVPASSVNGTTTVGNMLTYLQTLVPDATIPVIYADYNQTGAEDSLWVSAKVQVWNADMTVLKEEWQLDTVPNDSWDEAFPTFNYATINFYGTQAACDAAGLYNPVTNPDGCAGVTANGDAYTNLDHNLGSGKPDFLVFAPDMDLSRFAATDLFVFTANIGCVEPSPDGGAGATVDPLVAGTRLGCNTNGFEEFGIVGAVARQQVPEPAPLALMALGLGALAWGGRRRQAA